MATKYIVLSLHLHVTWLFLKSLGGDFLFVHKFFINKKAHGSFDTDRELKNSYVR